MVWWKAELRARQHAVRAAERPISITQRLAAATAVGAGIGLLSRADFQIFSTLFADRSPALYLALGAAALIAPLALYLVFSDE